MQRKNWMKWIVISGVGLAVAGCESNAGNGALIGGAAGAGAGAIIGHNSHGNTAGGAVIGGAVGAISGALIGGEVDRQQAEQREADRARVDANGYDYSDDRPVYVERDYPPDGPPPPVRYEVVTVRPYPSAVWVGGYWIRRPHEWIWVRGHWR